MAQHLASESDSLSDYAKREESIKRKLSSAAKSSGSEILKRQVEKEKIRDRPEIQEKCQMAHMLVDEGCEMYKSGDMTFEEFVMDLHKSLMAISGHTGKGPPEGETEDQEKD